MLSFLFFLLISTVIALRAPCPQLPPHNATSIYDLSPVDIKVVMNVGDSITAGIGIRGIDGLANEYRGQVFSIGCDPNATSVPNFLKQVSGRTPVGCSVGSHDLEPCFGYENCPGRFDWQVDQYNGALSGASAVNVIGPELDYLIGSILNDRRVDVKNDWKLFTILIGANDLCGACSRGWENVSDAAQWQVEVKASIERVRVSLPRTFVNLVPLFNLSNVYWLSWPSVWCMTVHRNFPFECGCMFDSSSNGNTSRHLMDLMGLRYNAALYELEAEYRAQNYSDFAVVVQPFLQDVNVAQYPLDYISDLDCFHPGLLAHQLWAVGLWNNMLTPLGQKATAIPPGTPPICPDQNSRFWAA